MTRFLLDIPSDPSNNQFHVLGGYYRWRRWEIKPAEFYVNFTSDVLHGVVCQCCRSQAECCPRERSYQPIPETLPGRVFNPSSPLLRLKRIPVREETRPSVVLVRVHHLWTASQWSGLWLLRGGTCASSRQMVLTGNRLSCFWTASSETLVMVERMTRGLGSIPLITTAIFPGSTSSRDRKGMPQVWQTLTRDHDAPSNHLFSKGLPVATAAGSQLEAGWPGTPPLMIQWGLFYYLVQLTSVVHQGVRQSNQWLATA